MSCSDQCQCKTEPTVEVPFTQSQAERLWFTLQGHAERMAGCLEARERAGDYGNGYSTASAEHYATQELADIVHRALHPAEYADEPPTEWLWGNAPEVEVVLPPVFTALATELVALAEGVTKMAGAMADYFEAIDGE